MVSKSWEVSHHFFIPYSPWSNGAVERLGKEMIRVFRSVASELQLSPEEWTYIGTSTKRSQQYPFSTTWKCLAFDRIHGNESNSSYVDVS